MTLIDKAEALAAIESWFAETKSFAPPSLLDAIAALPARGVGVKPESEAQFAEWFRKNYPGPDTIIHKPDWHAPRIFRAALAALEPTEPPEEIGILRARVEDQTATIAALRRELAMGRAAPTDAAQAREAAIRECADALRKVIDYAAFAGADPDEVEDDAINSYADYLLTLIDKPHEQRE